MLQQRLESLANRALSVASVPGAPLPRWPFAQRFLKYLQQQTTPKRFAESVRAMIEALVTACQEEQSPNTPPAPYSNFTAEEPFNTCLPFMELHAGMATDPNIALEPTNFALPSVKAEEPWPPAESNLIHPVYIHAVQQLRVIESAVQNRRSRSAAARHELPELPIALNAEPCVSMLLHPGRLVTTSEEPMIRIAIVSMLVREALPDEIAFTVRAVPWDVLPDEPSGAPGAAPGGGAGGGGGRSSPNEPLVVFSVYRDEFTQEGPSGPIEAKRILLLRALPLQRTRVTFEMEPEVRDKLGFCVTPPLLIDHRAAGPGEARDGKAAVAIS